MALAVRASKTGEKSQLVLFLTLTLVLGGVFLGVKVVEYAEKFSHHLVPGEHFAFHDAALRDGAQIYFSLYFAMTGLHATHMILGGLVLLPMIVNTRPRDSQRWSPVWAPCTARAMVRLLAISTTVLKAPSVMSSSWLAAWNACGYAVR